MGGHVEGGLVALLAEGVDRNKSSHETLTRMTRVALLAEGVDRNAQADCNHPRGQVALLAEGVDRNRTYTQMNG